jgi:hypothetical protein
LFDRRFAASAAFADRARRRGLALTEIDGDVTALWFDDLYHVWNEARYPTVGCLHDASVFCLDLLARDQGMMLSRLAASIVGDDFPARRGQRLTGFVIAARGAPLPVTEGLI